MESGEWSVEFKDTIQFRFIELLRGAIPSPGGKVARLSAAKEKGSEEERRHLKYRKKYEQR